MRYSSAVLLSTIAVGQAAASNLHHRHASFHARRQAEAKRSAGSDVNWPEVAYDLKNVDWEAVNWSSVFASTPAAQATPVPEQKEDSYAAAPTSTAEAKEEAPTPAAPTKAAVKQAETSEAAKPSKSNVGDFVSDIVDDLMEGVEDLASKLGCKVGVNDKSDNGGIWIGDDSAWGMEVTNSGDKDAVWYCWKANGFSGMSINVNVPAISVGLKPGQKVDLSFAANVPAACAPVMEGSNLALFGGIEDTWAEVTYGQWGAFDVSRNVNMRGTNISMKGSKCTSDMETCVYKCKDESVKSCEKGTDYDCFNCHAGNGGGTGYDPIMAGTGGGCSMGTSGEKISVSFW